MANFLISGICQLKGEIERGLGNYQKAFKLYFKALEIVEEVEGDTSVQYGLLCNDIGLQFKDRERYREALEMFQKSYRVEEQGRHRAADLNTLLLHVAIAHAFNGDFARGVDIMEQELSGQLSGDSIHHDIVIYTLQELSRLFYDFDQYEDAAKYLHQLIAYFDSDYPDDHIWHAHALKKLGNSFEMLGKQDTSVYFFRRAIAKHHQLGDTISTMYLSNMDEIGDHYYSLDVYDSALVWYNQGIELCEKLGYDNYHIYFNLLFGRANIKTAYRQYDQAEKAYDKLIDAIPKSPFGEDWLLGNALHGKAICQAELIPESPDPAMQSYARALMIFDDDTQYSSSYVHTLNLMADCYLRFGMRSKAAEIQQKAFNYLKSWNKSGNDYHATGLRIMGDIVYHYGKDSSRNYYLLALSIYDSIDHSPSDYAWTLSGISDTYEDQQNYVAAEKYLVQALQTIERNYGKYHFDYVAMLGALSYQNRIQGRYANAIVFARESLEITREFVSDRSETYAKGLLSLAIAYKVNDQYREALQVLNELGNVLDENDARFANIYLDYMQNSGDVYDYMGNQKKAEALFRKMVVTSEDIFGPSHEKHAYYLREIGKFYSRQGMSEEALFYLLPALDIVVSLFGKTSGKYIEYADPLGDVYFRLDNFARAEAIRTEIPEINKALFGEDSWDYITSRRDYARLLDQLGRYAEAEVVYMEVLQSIEREYGYNSWQYGYTCEDLGMMYRRWDKPQKALRALIDGISSVRSNEESVESDHYDLFHILGLVYVDIGEVDSAEYYLARAYEGAREKWGDKSASYYANNLAFVYLMRDDFKRAEELYFEYAGRFENKEPTDLDRVNFEDNLAALYLAWGKMDLAKKYWASVTETLLQKINAEFTYTSESEKASFWDAYKDDFEFYNTYAIRAGEEDPGALGSMLDIQLQTKSILLSASTKERRRILNSGDSALIAQFFEYTDLNEALARYYGYTEEQIATESINIDSLESLVNEYEKTLSINADQLASEERVKKVRWQDIQRSLKDHEAAIEMIRFRYFSKQVTDSVIYAALILTNETRRNPILVVLPNGNELEDRFLKSYRSSIQYQLDDVYSYQNFWEKIDEHLKGKKVVYFSPDAIYNQININTLRRPDGSYILDHYNVQLLTSTRDILLLEKETKRGLDRTVASLFGYPKYDLAHNTIENIVVERAIERNRELQRDVDLTRFGFSELPGTKTETETITRILNEKQWNTDLYLGSDALEEILKSVYSPTVLHIATHGFFLDDISDSKELTLGVSSEKSRQDPLLRSGLLMAGAAQTVKGDYAHRTENGIFTAYEAMNLDLSHTELVVLSACETGRGEVKSGEGVYGLQRAFQIAGTDAIVMSLWKVNDEATQLLMTHFYENWLGGIPKNEAFKMAQLEVRNQYDHPYYWGAFVMIGG